MNAHDSFPPDSEATRLCQEGILAEFEGRVEESRVLYATAWARCAHALDACIAAHYMARSEPSAEGALLWNLLALACADAVNDDRVRDFYPSLNLNVGMSFERLANWPEAHRYYRRSGELGRIHQSSKHAGVL